MTVITCQPINHTSTTERQKSTIPGVDVHPLHRRKPRVASYDVPAAPVVFDMRSDCTALVLFLHDDAIVWHKLH